MTKEALKLALEALKSMKETLAEHDEPTTFNEDQAITAIEEALAQPEQEPVAELAGVAYVDDLDLWHFYPLRETDNFPDGTKFYTTPPQRKPLTTQEIREWWASENGLEDYKMAKLDDFEQVVRAVEAAHGIKGNT